MTLDGIYDSLPAVRKGQVPVTTATGDLVDERFWYHAAALGSASHTGRVVNEIVMLETTAVYRAIRLISESIGSMPMHLYRHDQVNGDQKATDHPLYKKLNKKTPPLGDRWRVLRTTGRRFVS